MPMMYQLNSAQISYQKKRREQENKIKAVLKDILVYCLFVWILFIVAFSKVDKDSYNYNKSLQILFAVHDNNLNKVNLCE